MTNKMQAQKPTSDKAIISTMQKLLIAKGVKCRLEERKNGTQGAYKYNPLVNEDFSFLNEKGTKVSTYQAYVKACDNYCKMLYNYTNRMVYEHYSKTAKKLVYTVPTEKECRDTLNVILKEHLKLDDEMCHKVHSSLNAYSLDFTAHGQRLTANASSEKRELNKKIASIENLETLTAEQKALQKKPFEEKIEKILKGANYTQENTRPKSVNAFRLSLESRIAYIVAGVEYREKYMTLDEKKKTAKWAKLNKDAIELKISQDEIDTFIKANDVEGLQAYIKETKARHNLIVEMKASKKKLAEIFTKEYNETTTENDRKNFVTVFMAKYDLKGKGIENALQNYHKKLYIEQTKEEKAS